MVEQVAHPRSWGRVVGRFALALVLIIVSGSITNAGYEGMVPAVFALVALGVLVWAVVGLVRAVAARRARK